ncbi:MAG: PAS domain S-box protein [Candidatus Cloacimonetes bacterium]|nr:PAS domain S-box protein [Candidatus Cloacimonadota bacterium]
MKDIAMENEQIYRTFFQNFQGIAFQIKMDYKVLFLQGEVNKITGYSTEELISDKFELDTLIHPEDLPEFLKINDTKLKKIPEYSLEREYRIITRSGQIRWVHEQVHNICDDRGNPVLLQGIISDITDRKQADLIQMLLYNIAQAVNTTKNLDELYCLIHHYLGMIIENRNFYLALINEVEDMITFPYYHDDKDIQPDPVPRKLSTGLSEYVIRTGKSLWADTATINDLIRTKQIHVDGSMPEVWVGIPLKNDNRIIGIMALQSYDDAGAYDKKDLKLLEFISYQIASAITRKKSEQLNHQLSEIIRNSSDGIVLTNPEGLITYVNPAFEKMSGYTPNELLRSDPAELIVTKDVTSTAGIIRNSVRTQGEWKHEIICRRKNGEHYHVESRVFPIYDDQGEIIWIAATQQDITERKKAQEIQRVLYKISKASLVTNDIPELCSKIRDFLSIIIDTTNFYVAIFEEESNMISFVYYEDENIRQSNNLQLSRQFGKGLTEYVIKTGMPLYAPRKVQQELAQKKIIDLTGTPAEFWIGVPLKADNKTIGVIAVQSYDPDKQYSENDIEILSFISDELAHAVNRKNALDQIKQNLRVKEVLIKELYHRTKNNMQIISSMLRLKARHSSDEIKEIFRDVNLKIQTMSLVHKKLYQSRDLSEIDLKDYIEDLAELLADSFTLAAEKVTFRLDLENILITMDTAIPLGLILNELISNIFKHAFPEQLKGEIFIGLHLDEQNFINIRVEDNGIGIPADMDLRKESPMGLNIVITLIESQLKGQVKYRSENGLKWQIRLQDSTHIRRI